MIPAINQTSASVSIKPLQLRSMLLQFNCVLNVAFAVVRLQPSGKTQTRSLLSSVQAKMAEGWTFVYRVYVKN